MLEFFKKLNPFKSLQGKVDESMNDHLGKASATRINGYFMTALIYILAFVICSIEIYSAYVGFTSDKHSYTPSNQIMMLVTLVFGQQALLFQLKRKGEETSFPTLEAIESSKPKQEETILEESTEDDFSEYKEDLSCENCDCEGECVLGKDGI